jgi:hypothetical protein
VQRGGDRVEALRIVERLDLVQEQDRGLAIASIASARRGAAVEATDNRAA